MLLFKGLSSSETLSFHVFIFLLSTSSKIVNENQWLPPGHLELTCTTHFPRTCIFFETKSLASIWPSLNLPPCFVQYFGDQLLFLWGFPGGSDGKESTCNAGDAGLIPGSGISRREGNSYPLQYSCLDNSVDRGAWWATVHGVTERWTLESTSPFCFSAQCRTP